MIKQLLHLLMARERAAADQPEASLPTADTALVAALHSLSTDDLLATIRRQRLETVLAADAHTAELLPGVAPALQRLNRRECMAALALASFSRDLAILFEQARIPMLVIKGVALALQTTGSLAARGRGDLDLFVDPRHLQTSVQLLRSQGFAWVNPDDQDYVSRSITAPYYRWIGYSTGLMRQLNGGLQTIDLHWRLDARNRHLPNFHRSHQRREAIRIGETCIYTLNRSDAFLHVCAHAARDRWMCLRNLVDIHRLAYSLAPAELKRLQRLTVVRLSCGLAHDATGGSRLQPPGANPQSLDSLIHYATTTHQLSEWRHLPGRHDSPRATFLSQYVTFIGSDYGRGPAGWSGLAAEIMRFVLPRRRVAALRNKLPQLNPTQGAPTR